MAEEWTEDAASLLFGRPKPEPIQRPDEPTGGPPPAESSPPAPPPVEAVDPLVEHLAGQANRRGDQTERLLGERPRAAPSGPDAASAAERKREQQRDLIEALHGDKVPGLPPIEPTAGPDYRAQPEPAAEPPPREFRPPYAEPDD